ncbi:octaprenyl-diphosphate synthase [Haloferula helveola]|uniref:Octaprenyl-diphosphate synthase n=1 Tax=Haloferula helveola TaxID=490095 RepID=A0ABM7R8H0_9BACT|nr:octaprenyl-diphosphate synthase [Haloferula helveola]
MSYAVDEDFEKSAEMLRAMPELADFAGLGPLIDDYEAGVGQTALVAYRMLTPEAEWRDTIAVQAAIYAAALASFLIDDVMDRDESKPAFGMDDGRKSNLGGALLVAVYKLIGQSEFPHEVRQRLADEMSDLLLAASAAQEVEALLMSGDLPNPDPEANYWKVIHGKSSQQVGRNLKLGAIMAGRPEWEQPMYELGVAVGDMSQIYDDITDAIYKIISPDWESTCKNLLIIFCLHENNPRREEFIKHFKSATTDPEAHTACRQIMIESGAVGYAVYHYFTRYKNARKLIESFEGVDQSYMLNLLNNNIRPISHVLTELGVPLPEGVAEELKLEGDVSASLAQG